MKFKVGDKVRFIGGDSSKLKQDGVYTVRKRNGDDGIFLEEFTSPYAWWYDRRFEPAKISPPKPEGIRTLDQVKADRRKEILDGIVRYHTSGVEVPQEWLIELAHTR